MNLTSFFEKAFDKLLSPRVKSLTDKVILIIAIASYLIHLICIVLNSQGLLSLDSSFFSNPISAIYTPFSFILVYEVYLLIFYLPKSISSYIAKQYEIITLIVIRRIFKDIGNLEFTSNWFENKNDLVFTFDVATSLILFLLIFFFYRNISSRNKKKDENEKKIKPSIQRFILLKKAIATILVPTLFILAIYTFYSWFIAVIGDNSNGLVAFKNINNVFFDEFFTVLIIVDVLLLLASFFYSNKFYKIIRNSGFVISTILIKISFSAEGIITNALIIGAVLFGILILLIHNLYENKLSNN